MKPGQRPTGIRGYFGYRGSVNERSHIENREPRPVRTTRWWAHAAQRPKSGALITSHYIF